MATERLSSYLGRSTCYLCINYTIITTILQLLTYDIIIAMALFTVSEAAGMAKRSYARP